MRANSQTTAKAFVNIFERKPPAENLNAVFAAEQDEEILLSHLRFAEKIFPKSGLGLCPISHTRMTYFSLSCEQILGHPHERLMQMGLQDFFALLHPEDLPSVQQCFAFIKSLMPFDPEVYRFAIQYRIRNKQNEYMPILNENIAIRITEDSYLYLMLYNRLTAEEKFYHVKLDVYKKVNGNFLKTSTYNPKQAEKELTPRQTDISRLVVKGYTNQEIADRLGVSVYTVKNHKQMLFRKINVRNSIELANYVKES